MPDKIDKAVDKLVPAFERLQDAIVKLSLNIYNQKPTLQQISELPLFELVTGELGGTALIEAITKVSSRIATVKNPNLRAALGKLDEQYFINELGKAAANAKEIIAEAFISNYSEETLKRRLTEGLSNLSEKKIGSLLNTSIRTTERMAYAELIDDLPDDTVFEYVGGALIPTSRPFCVQWYGKRITLGELKELTNDDGAPAITAAGGYNCRHSFEEVFENGKE